MSRTPANDLDPRVQALLDNAGAGRRRRSRGRFWLILLGVYLLLIALGAVAVWRFTPQRVKDAVFQTYVDPDSTQLTPRN
jgi:hypothetical protein